MGNPLGIIPIVFFVLLTIWLGVITYFLFRSIRHYNTLVKLGDRKTLSSIMDQLLNHAKKNHQSIIHLEQRMQHQEKNSDLQIQKIGLMHYNPFSDTGGEQSFLVSLLDNHNSGIILTSLQGRSGTRWYAKKINKGKGVEFDLSKEEEEVIKKSKKLS